MDLLGLPMADPACPSCGNINPTGTEKCLKCGTIMPAATRTVTCPNCKNVNPIGTLQCINCGTELPLNYLKPNIVKEGVERKGLGALKLAALSVIIAGLMVYIFPAVTWAYYGYQLPYSITLPPPPNLIVPPVPDSLKVALLAIALVGVGLAAVAWFAFARGFAMFSQVDPTFKQASMSAYIGIIAAVLVGAAIGYNIDAVYNYLNCLNATPGAASCAVNLTNAQYTIYWLWAFSILFFIFGGIGVLIGLFRLGARYLTGTFWAAGFLMIFPILILIGGVVLLLATMAAGKRIESWEKAPEPKPAPGTAGT